MRCNAKRYGTATIAVTIINMEVAAVCCPEMAVSFTRHKAHRAVEVRVGRERAELTRRKLRAGRHTVDAQPHC